MRLADNKKWCFSDRLGETGLADLRRGPITTLQVNLGKRCNQACLHCHVEAGPKRTESMSRETATRVMKLFAESASLQTLDITGGAPELNENFRWMVEQARDLGREVIDRCNLTIFFEEGMEGLPEFLADKGVRVVASMPCYSLANVDAQRGKGAFDKSIRGLKILNDLGYGKKDSGLVLDLVYNPGGPFLPPAQETLEARYREELASAFGIEFSALFTLTNLPVKRFADALLRSGELERYMDMLVDNFNAATLPGLMCLTQLSISWDGQLFDCDFNQMLEIAAEVPTRGTGGLPVLRNATIDDLESVDQLRGGPVRTASHCFGCTAGAGSSCGGAISS
jgi:radical SAM/Cys-rich protein